MELLWDGETKVCSNGPGHKTKMAAMPIYGKNPKKSSSPEPKGQWPWNLVCIIECSSTTNFAQMMTLGWPWPILWQGQIWSLMFLYGLWFETSNRWPKWQEVYVYIKTLSPLGCMPTAPELYTWFKSWKKLYKIRPQRDFFETCNKWVKW